MMKFVDRFVKDGPMQNTMNPICPVILNIGNENKMNYMFHFVQFLAFYTILRVNSVLYNTYLPNESYWNL